MTAPRHDPDPALPSDQARHPTIDLDGTWLAAPVGALDPTTSVADTADALLHDWSPITVPGHWRSTPGFSDTDGPVRYRRSFGSGPHRPGPTAGGDRSWLVLDGIFYASDVWLDGTYLGPTEGYFFPHTFEVTDLLRARTEHTLALEVACAPQSDRRAKRNLTGVFQHWDLLDQQWNPGGIWRSVRLEHSGPVRIRHLRVVCTEATAESATVWLHAVLDALDATTAEIHTTLAGASTVERRSLAAGENRLDWTVVVPEPRRWWPRALGDQPLEELTLEVRDGKGRPSDRAVRRVGLRTVSMRDWICSVNGERLFLKGANQGPTRMALAEASDDELVRDVSLAVDAGLDLLRVHGHISRPALYDAADEAGLLLWQDLPLQWGYARSVRAQARRQAREAVDLLAHHPSVAIWCGHNEPFAVDVTPDAIATPRGRLRIGLAGLRSTLLPTWNKSVLDHSIARVLRRTDGSRPVVPHSGVFPHPPQLDGTDSHLYFGWYVGEYRQFGRIVRTVPRLARFVSEFGAQAVPQDASFLDPDRWPDLDLDTLDWEAAAERHSLQKVFFDRYVPPEAFDSFADWAAATRRYQAELIRYHVETLRRIKYRPTGGFAQFCFADGYPSVTWSVLDAERRPKPGYDALRAACAPVLVVGAWLDASYPPGATLSQDLHVVSDERVPLADLRLEAIASFMAEGDGDASQEREPGTRQVLTRREWAGGVEADSVTYVGRLEVTLPTVPGTLEIALTLHGARDLAPLHTTYTTSVVA